MVSPQASKGKKHSPKKHSPKKHSPKKSPKGQRTSKRSLHADYRKIANATAEHKPKLSNKTTLKKGDIVKNKAGVHVSKAKSEAAKNNRFLRLQQEASRIATKELGYFKLKDAAWKKARREAYAELLKRPSFKFASPKKSKKSPKAHKSPKKPAHKKSPKTKASPKKSPKKPAHKKSPKAKASPKKSPKKPAHKKSPKAK